MTIAQIERYAPGMLRPTARTALAAPFALDPELDFLNHGSFGACPRAVLEHQSAWRARLEQDPVRFLLAELEPALGAVRAAVASFVRCRTQDLVFVANATSGVNAVLASLDLAAGDEVLITNHTYNACKNAAEYWTRRAGAALNVAQIPFPLDDPEQVVEAVLAAASPRTRIALLDHVTSPTALVFPIERLVASLAQRGVQTLVDGAHAPGMLPLDLDALGADYYVGNLHKWCCAPKAAALLHVRADRQRRLRPSVVSHGYSSARTDRARWQLEFDWTGTADPSALLSVPFALSHLAALVPGGWDEIRRRNAALARAARRLLAERLDLTLPCPDSMLGSMAALILPTHPRNAPVVGWAFAEPLYSTLLDRDRIQVPVSYWPASPTTLLRISAHLYNELDQYQRLADALAEAYAGQHHAPLAPRASSAAVARPSSRALRAGIATFEVVRRRGDALERDSDAVAVEEPLEIRVEGEPWITTMRTPGNDPELVAGLLLGEGVIASHLDLSTLAPCGRLGEEGYGNVIEVSLTAGTGKPPVREPRTTSRLASAACGVCGRASIEDLLDRLAPLEDDTRYDPAWLAALPDALRAEQRNFAHTGGLHAAALARPGQPLLVVREDVGRHNAVDKVVGRLLLDAALPARGSALVVSGRASFELVQKALCARVPALVCVSAPSSLAVSTARRFGLLLVGFARGGAFNAYAGAERLLQPPG